MVYHGIFMFLRTYSGFAHGAIMAIMLIRIFTKGILKFEDMYYDSSTMVFFEVP